MTNWRKGYVRSRDKINVSTCRRPMCTKLDKFVTYRESYSLLRSCNPLIPWSTSWHVTSWNNYIFTFTRPTATKFGRVLISRIKFKSRLPSQPRLLDSSIVKWGYPDNFKPVYFFLEENISHTQKHVTSENQLTKQKTPNKTLNNIDNNFSSA